MSSAGRRQAIRTLESWAHREEAEASYDHLLEVEDIDLSFKGLQALSGVGFHVDQGELFAIIGPNGAGKTSIFNCLNGVYRPQRGEIRWAGKSILGVRPDRIARLGISRTFQNIELFAHMTVLENLSLGRHVRTNVGWLAGSVWWGKAKREEMANRELAEAIIDLLEIKQWRKYPVALLPSECRKGWSWAGRWPWSPVCSCWTNRWRA